MTTNESNATNHDIDAGDVLDTMTITKIERRKIGGGAWVTGTIGGHSFEALVFPAHAEIAGYELDDSRISKLWLAQISDRLMVACFDRGWDVLPTTDAARTIVDLLAAGLAESVYGN